MTTRFTLIAVVLLFAVLSTACASDDLDAAASAPARGGQFPDLYDPSDDGEELPDNYRRSVPRDLIRPVYDPAFVGPSGVDWPDDELVIGVDLLGEQRAYPVGFLTWREIVIDNHRGIPTMVTW